MATALLRPPLYDQDYLAWTEQQVALLRAGRTEDLDLGNLIEELEDMGRGEWRELENRLEVLLAHMLKRDYQPEKRSRSWDDMIDEQRRRIVRLFRRSPSLKRDLATTIGDVYPDAMRRAARETRLRVRTFPEALPYAVAEVLEHDPLP